MRILPAILVAQRRLSRRRAADWPEQARRRIAGLYTLSVKVQLVVEAVVVKDKDGKPIQGLTAKDFTVTEDGVPQTIRFCERQNLVEQSAPLPVIKPGTEDIKIYKHLARTQIAPETEDNERYKNRRLLALYFDMSTMRPADQLRALSAAKQFVRTQMTASISSPSFATRAPLSTSFRTSPTTATRSSASLTTLVVGEAQGDTETTDDCQQRRHRGGLRPGRQRVQCLQYRSPTLSA
jgi:VWFA-related protein